MSIYKDLQTLEELIDTCFDPVTGEICAEDDEAYQSLKKEIAEGGLERCAKYLKNQEAFIHGAIEEVKRIEASVKREEKHLDWLRGYMYQIYQESPKDKNGKVVSGTFTFGQRKSTAVQVDANFNNPLFMAVKTEERPDKKAIKEALESGIEVQGARLVTNYTLTIK